MAKPIRIGWTGYLCPAGIGESDSAFTAGILHDLGCWALLWAHPATPSARSPRLPADGHFKPQPPATAASAPVYTNSTKARGSDADSFGLDRPPPVTGGWGGGCVGSAIAVGSGVAVAVGSLVGVGSAVGSVGWRNPIRHWPDGIFVPHRLAEARRA